AHTQEIRDRYPPWLESHQGVVPPEDYRRYVGQYEAVQRVCAHYETAPTDCAKLMDLIQEMQTYGDPPGDIVEEITGGAGRDLNSILGGADGGEGGDAAGGPVAPALEELSGELDKCKVQ
ncbi:Peroxisome biogenesis protein 19-1, partial [Tetrabaena socialis]